jgi:predicted nucleic acid-binding protein
MNFAVFGTLGGLPGAVSRRHKSKKNNYPVADDTVSTGLRVKKPVADRNIIFVLKRVAETTLSKI